MHDYGGKLFALAAFAEKDDQMYERMNSCDYEHIVHGESFVKKSPNFCKIKFESLRLTYIIICKMLMQAIHRHTHTHTIAMRDY